MKLKPVQAILLIVLAIFLLTGCGGGGSSSGGGGSVTVSAQVDTATYTVVPKPTWLDKVYALFGGETVYALGTGVVNQVVAIASSETGVFLENMVTADIDPGDGSFSINLDRSYEWVLLLVNTEAPNKFEKVVSYVATKVTDTDNLVAYSGTSLTSNLALGTLVNEGEEAVGTSNLLAFSLDLAELTAVAQADNGYKHMINAYLNYDPATGRSYGIAPIFGFQAGDIADFTGAIAAPQVEGGGLSFFIETADLELPLNITDICLGLGDFGLYPPGAISDAAGKVYGPSDGIVNDGNLTASGGTNMGSENGPWDDGCYDGDMGVSFPDGVGSRHLFMGLKTAEDQLQIPVTGMPEGHWKLKSGLGENEKIIAEFDLAVGSPFDVAGNLTIPVPSIQVVSETDGKITAINTSWFVYSSSAGGYVPLTGRNAFAVGSLVSGSVVSIQDEDGPDPGGPLGAYNVFLKDPGDFHSGVGGTPYPHMSDGLWATPIDFTTEVSPESPSWYLPGSSGAAIAGNLSPTHIRVDVAIGGVDYQFSFNGPDYMPQ
ncbi:MAG: hypothetical protein RQ754_03320 [Desulfuromonadales bacterium]|nr:hypothetical protein [Desulfuromonadales bacterium]